ncbi:MAG: flagellar hook-basal body complex protein, partial [Defluviitaleaceae bacterium]|nr:flagellar hook-basal body complex protein [Defluviitaleaceae bacterium]
GRPVNLQVGLGVRPVATSRDFGMGSFERTDQPLDIAISGRGFLNVRHSPEGAAVEVIAYTKDGALQAMPAPGGDGTLMLVTNQGLPILDVDGDPIIFEDWVHVPDLRISQEGLISHRDPEDIEAPVINIAQLAISQFPNIQGLEAVGNNLFLQTGASGAPIMEIEAMEGPVEVTSPSTIVQGVLEMSNVNVANEMVNLITTQRAYELNARAISTSDQMLQEAVNLRR